MHTPKDSASIIVTSGGGTSCHRLPLKRAVEAAALGLAILHAQPALLLAAGKNILKSCGAAYLLEGMAWSF